MVKAVWMSDLHFVHQGDVLGHDPRVRLSAAIEHINAHHADASVCVISGDMVNRGTPEDYTALRVALDQLAIPYLPMVGNHDTRALLRTHLPLPVGAMPDFVQYIWRTPDGLVICLDTQKESADAGEFCASRTAWLEQTLTEAGDRPSVLFLHHPPLALGLPMQDSDRMEEGEAFLDLVGRFPSVRQLCLGHVHRPISGVVRGIPFSTMGSVLYQAPPPVPVWDWSSFEPSPEAPRLGILTLSGGDVTVQTEQFCPYERGTGA